MRKRDRLLAFTARRLLGVPAPVARALARRERVVIEGNELDPSVQLLLAMSSVAHGDVSTLPIEEARRSMDRSSVWVLPAPRDVEVSDRTVAGATGPLRARVYRPRGLGERAPAVVFFHGGGWSVGSITSHDGIARLIADEARAVVISVDYRLAPEHAFPAAVDDAFAAYRFVVDHAAELGVDPARLAVAGDSAGGNLAAVVCLDAREHGVRLPRAQLLIYPATDMRRSAPSHRTFAEGFLLTKASMDGYSGYYVPGGGERLDHPRASPLRAKDLAGLPAALVLTAGFDPLRDEGRAYADRLEEAGVPVRYRCATGMVHGFASFAGAIPRAEAFLIDAAAWLRQTLA